MTQTHIEFLHVNAWHYPKSEIAHGLIPARHKFHFWSSGDTCFDDPRLFLKHIEGHDYVPQVNLTHFACISHAHRVDDMSLLEIEIEHRWASDSVAHDLPVFMAAFKRQQALGYFHPGFVQFTLVYQVTEFVLHDAAEIEYTCLGELDYSRIADICIRPDAATENFR